MKNIKLKNYKVTVETILKFRNERNVLASSIDEAENLIELPKAQLNYNYNGECNPGKVSEEVTVTAEELPD